MKKSIVLLVFLFVFGFRSYGQVQVESPNDSSEIFMVIEIQPEYPGGYAELTKFIEKEKKYPASAKKEKIAGTVYVGFVVNKDGTLSDIKTMKGIHPDCDKEAERIVNAMPKWKPGKRDGKLVDVRFVLPIKFIL